MGALGQASSLGGIMSRDEKVAVIESFLHGIVSKKLDQLPIDPEITFESPLIPERRGRAAALEYLKGVAAALKGIRVVQHIVEGDHVATLFDEETVNGPLQVFAKFQIASGRIRDARVFYDPRRIARST
jgi:hypothetical protein